MYIARSYDLVLDILNNQENVDVVYLDFSKAFDKVDHIIALKKIKSHKKLYLVFNRKVSLIPLFLSSSSAILTKKLSIQKSPSGSINEVKKNGVYMSSNCSFAKQTIATMFDKAKSQISWLLAL